MENIIAKMLSRSPMRPLQKHVETACKAAKLLPDLFVAANLNDWQKVEELNSQIRKLENDADELKLDIRSNLPKSLFMPVPRQDLLELVLVQDKVANVSKKIAALVKLRKLQIPVAMYDDFLAFVKCSVKVANKAKKSVHELDELYETGFRGAEVKVVQELIAKLDELETESDDRQSDLQESLFAMEQQLPPIEAMFLYKVIDLVGDVADMAERIGRRLELLLAK